MKSVRLLSLPKPNSNRYSNAGIILLPLAALLFIGCGGGGPGFAPDDIPDLVLWLDAQAIKGLRNADPLSTWQDSSGRGNHARQQLGLKQPKFVTQAHNGRPGVRFDGQNDVMTISDSGSLDIGTGNLSILAVYSRRDSTQTNLRLIAKGASTDRRQGYAIMGSNDILRLIVSNGQAKRVFVGSTNQVPDQATLSTFVVDRGAAMRAYRDGALQGTVSLHRFGVESWDNHQDMTIGGLNPKPDIPWVGDLMELLIFRRHLSEIEHEALAAYLSDKWGIELRVGQTQGRLRRAPDPF